jgi:hypothetical protein
MPSSKGRNRGRHVALRFLGTRDHHRGLALEVDLAKGKVHRRNLFCVKSLLEQVNLVDLVATAAQFCAWTPG